MCEELFAGSKSHLAVVYAWLVGKKKRGARMWTDGKRLYSYNIALHYFAGGFGGHYVRRSDNDLGTIL